ncbi:MAG: hypothetical protein HY290_26050 [Planctomycetia bacterium]|nr:hypothetical protein [Planctomycetia bacterium]
MHFVGKILVVLQLVLSVLFLAFAAVVYNTHMSWRDAYNKQKQAAAKSADEKNTVLADYDRFKNEMTAKVNAAEGRAAQVDANNKALEAQLAQVQKTRDENAVALKAAGESAEIAHEEALARWDEAAILRKLKHDQAMKLNEQQETITRLEDQVHNSALSLGTAVAKNKDLLGQNSTLRQALEAAGITADAAELAARTSPPPRVDGKILENRPPRRQGASELVEISLGSDDGLKKGHEMSIYRAGGKDGQLSKYLGRMKIVKTEPDRAVGEVIESSRNGVIQKGDNVTTKL